MRPSCLSEKLISRYAQLHSNDPGCLTLLEILEVYWNYFFLLEIMEIYRKFTKFVEISWFRFARLLLILVTILVFQSVSVQNISR